MGDAVNDMQEAADHSSQSITSSMDIKMSDWTAAEMQEMQRLLVSVAVFTVCLLL